MIRHLALRPPSRFVQWAERLAFVSVPIAILAVLLTRSDQISKMNGVLLLAAAALVATLALALAIVGSVDIWRHGRTGLAGLFRAGFVAVLVLALPAYLAIQAGRLPTMNDVTTDILDPPVFSRSARSLAARNGYVHPSLDQREREKQRFAYADLRTIVLEVEAEEAFRSVKDAVTTLKWRIIEEAAPGGRSGQGRIEAVAESQLMRFQDDIVIRIRPSGAGTRIDVRSASRVGKHDFGANAQRIRRLIEEINSPKD
ncbi:MAG: DUF1499 domain-containing protein [Rhabdaerophilum sp.]